MGWGMIVLTTECDNQGWQDQINWLDEMRYRAVETRPLYSYYTKGKWTGRRIVGGEFTFGVPREAMAFKLTWGGE